MFDLAVDLPVPTQHSERKSEQTKQGALVNGTAKATDTARNSEGTTVTDHRKARYAEKREKKRKRARETQKSTAGAGSRVETREGASRKSRRIDKDRERQLVEPVDKRDKDSDEDDLDEDDENASLALALAPRKEVQSEPQRRQLTDGTSHVEDEDPDAEAESGALEHTNHHAPKRTGFYLTTRYRHILGIVPLTADDDDESLSNAKSTHEDPTHHPPRINGHAEGAEDDDAGRSIHASAKPDETLVDGEQTPGLEIALIERPPWDLDLPPRFYGRHEHVER